MRWLPAIAFMLCSSPLAAQGAPCPRCPEGCIPSGFVESLKTPPPAHAPACPEACTALESVKVLKDEPGCRFAASELEQPAPVQDPPPAKQPAGQESTAHRGVYLPTAAAVPVGEFSMTGYGAGLWDLQYNLTENLQLGAQVVLPVYVVGAFPSIRARFPLTEHLSIGVGGLVGLAGPYAGDEAGGFLFLAAGHTQLTFQHGDHMVNLGLAVATAGLREEGEDLDMADGAILLPNFSYRWAFHRNWSAQLEVTAPLVVGSDGLANEEAIVVVAYGVRGHGEVMFGDVGFFLPLFDAYIDEVWKYTPIGIPYFSLGMKF